MRYCLGYSSFVLSEAKRCSVHRNHAGDSVGVLASQGHCCFSSQVVAKEYKLVDLPLICVPEDITGHFLVSHALVVVGLSVVPQIKQIQISLIAEDVVEGERLPVLPFAQQSVQEKYIVGFSLAL